MPGPSTTGTGSSRCRLSYGRPDVQVFHREPNPAGDRAEIEAVYDLVDVWGADASAELHFNASTTAAASGTETWYASEAGRVLAERVKRGAGAGAGGCPTAA